MNPRGAAEGLGRIGANGPEVRAALEAASKDADESVAKAAAESLKALNR